MFHDHFAFFVFFLCFFTKPSFQTDNEPAESSTSSWKGAGDEFEYIYSVVKGSSSTGQGHVIDKELKAFVKQFNSDYVSAMKEIRKISLKFEKTRNLNLMVEMNELKEVYESIIEQGWMVLKSMELENNKIADTELRIQIEEIIRLIRSNPPTSLRQQLDRVNVDMNELISRIKDGPRELGMKDTKYTLQNSVDEKKLRQIWWHFQTELGPKLLPLIEQYYDTVNNAAVSRGFKDISQYFWSEEKMTTFNYTRTKMKIIGDLSTIYKQLFSIIFHRLSKYYPDGKYLPFHLFGRVHPENEYLIPLSGVADIIKSRLTLNVSSFDWIDLANKYYTSIGLENLNIRDIKSHMVKSNAPTTDNKNAEIWNFFNKEYKLMWVASHSEEENMKTIFEGVAMIHNCINYQYLSPIQQNWPNQIFKEAIAGAAALSAFSPSYFVKAGIIPDEASISIGVIINRQLKSILQAFNQFWLGTITDLFILSQHEDKTHSFYTEKDFAKWLTIINMILQTDRPLNPFTSEISPRIKLMIGPMILRNFLSEVLKYQFFQRLCVVAGQFNPTNPEERPLYKCDISVNQNAGNVLKFVMQQGNSLTWEATLKLMTNTDNFDTAAFLNYYRPFINWLKNEAKNVPKELQNAFNVIRLLNYY